MYPPPCIGQAEPLRRPWDLTGSAGRPGKNAQADRQAGHWRGIGKGAALPPGPKPAAGYPCPRPAVGLAPAVAAARLLPGFAKTFGRMAFSIPDVDDAICTGNQFARVCVTRLLIAGSVCCCTLLPAATASLTFRRRRLKVSPR